MTITVATSVGTRDVTARKVVGAFAIHRPVTDLDRGQSRWVLTHLGSGARIAAPKTLVRGEMLASELSLLTGWDFERVDEFPVSLKEVAWDIVKDDQ